MEANDRSKEEQIKFECQAPSIFWIGAGIFLLIMQDCKSTLVKLIDGYE